MMVFQQSMKFGVSFAAAGLKSISIFVMLALCSAVAFGETDVETSYMPTPEEAKEMAGDSPVEQCNNVPPTKDT